MKWFFKMCFIFLSFRKKKKEESDEDGLEITQEEEEDDVETSSTLTNEEEEDDDVDINDETIKYYSKYFEENGVVQFTRV